ncbi:MAG TPA: alpha/beta hydrolase, partial [Myxococcaceae bacterium]|nr:alpha/beta hydrolase [Myxococcaceae bacterium]
VAWAAATSGYPVLRFNFRGVGASQGKSLGAQTLRADVDAAVRVLEENAGSSSTARLLIGASAQIVPGMLGRNPQASGVCLVSPMALSFDALGQLDLPVLVVVGELDHRLPRDMLTRAVAQAGGTLEVIGAADATFLRNLPQVGRAVVSWLQTLDPDVRPAW